MRPSPAGPWNIARNLRWFGKWKWSPKFNGYRAVVHVPTKTVFNRKGQTLSIASEFASAIEQLSQSPFEWLDCEGLERRHNIGRGSLVILDWMEPTLVLESRRAQLEAQFEIQPDLRAKMPNGSVLLVPEFDDPDALWEEANQANTALGVADFFEGLVGKRLGTKYDFQLKDPERTTQSWTKSRYPW